MHIFFWTLQIAFVVHNTTHGSNIKVTIFICGWCQAICSKLKCQMREFPLCFPNYPNFWPVVFIHIHGVTDIMYWSKDAHVTCRVNIFTPFFKFVACLALSTYDVAWASSGSTQIFKVIDWILSFQCSKTFAWICIASCFLDYWMLNSVHIFWIMLTSILNHISFAWVDHIFLVMDNYIFTPLFSNV